MAPLDYKSSLARYRRYLQAANSKPLWKASLYVILSLILIIVLVVLALRPTLITIAGLLGKIKEQNSIEQQLDRKIQMVTQANQELVRASSKLIFLDEALPTQADVAAWKSSLDNVASQAGISIEAIQIGDIPVDTESTTSAQVSFSISASGQYAELRQFLQMLQNLRRLITIENVTLARDLSPESTQLLMGVEGFLGEHQ